MKTNIKSIAQKTKAKTKKITQNNSKKDIFPIPNRKKSKRKNAEASLFSMMIALGILVLIITLIVLKRTTS